MRTPYLPSIDFEGTKHVSRLYPANRNSYLDYVVCVEYQRERKRAGMSMTLRALGRKLVRFMQGVGRSEPLPLPPGCDSGPFIASKWNRCHRCWSSPGRRRCDSNGLRPTDTCSRL